MSINPITRYLHIRYRIPEGAPDEVTISCSWTPASRQDWRPARVTPLVSETALQYVGPDARPFPERRAAGLERTVVFNPYPEAQRDGKVDIGFRVEIRTSDGKLLSQQQSHLEADNSDVVYLEDWSKVLQHGAVTSDPDPRERKWSYRTDQGSDVSFGSALDAKGGDLAVPQLTYPLDLRGWYAVFVCGKPGAGCIGLRLTGDERTDRLQGYLPFQEVLWRWCRMDRQHLVLRQIHTYAGFTRAHIDYVKFVPLTEELVRQLESPFTGKRDKLVAGYFEPYSWAFNADVTETLQHREPLSAFKEAGVDMVDIQVGRFGAKVVYESRKTDQLIYDTIGDPTDGVVPRTSNVGQMQQYTNTLDAELRYCRELGLVPRTSFGASICYIGTPLQGDVSREHPEWVNGHYLDYEQAGAREYILSLWREVLEIGAPGLSIDFCRYPEGVRKRETCTEFLRSLRRLADEFKTPDGKRIEISVRFPATGVRTWENFDYETWAKEGLVDYLCPSNIQGRHIHFDVAPYVKAAKGTRCRVMPVVDGIRWGPQMPGPYLWRAKQIYDTGADGIYMYQADDRVLSRPSDRRCTRMLGSREAIERWWKQFQEETSRHSKGIYITPPMDGDSYQPWERLRVWLEGIPMGEVEMILDGKRVNHFDGPPYYLGSEEYDSDKLLSSGEHTLIVRARDGDGWLEQRFTIKAP